MIFSGKWVNKIIKTLNKAIMPMRIIMVIIVRGSEKNIKRNKAGNREKRV